MSVRSMSGTGTEKAPNMSAAEISLGRWSTVLAENTERVPSPLRRNRRKSIDPRLWALGLPT